MKIISLNAYFGTAFDALLAFIEQHAPTTDIFCFQEMLSTPDENGVASIPPGRSNILEEIARRLPAFQMEFAVMQDNFSPADGNPGFGTLGIATFYKKELPVTKTGSFFIYNDRNTLIGTQWETLGHNTLFVQLEVSGTLLTLVSLHGNSQPGNKLDTPKRLRQSQKVIDFLSTQPGEKIVMGDFNLLPETQSVNLFVENGMCNLVADYHIPTTRGSLHKQLHPQYADTHFGFQEFADYTFVTPGIKVKSFEVPDVPISDHLPMILECEL